MPNRDSHFLSRAVRQHILGHFPHGVERAAGRVSEYMQVSGVPGASTPAVRVIESRGTKAARPVRGRKPPTGL